MLTNPLFLSYNIRLFSDLITKLVFKYEYSFWLVGSFDRVFEFSSLAIVLSSTVSIVVMYRVRQNKVAHNIFGAP